MLTDEQKGILNSGIDVKSIKEREGPGRKNLSYQPAWYIREELNRVFGFTGWSYRTVKCEEVWRGERPRKNFKTKEMEDKPSVSFMAICELTVNGSVYSDVGYGDATDSDHGKACELASKEASSDALKRCAANLGDHFGLCLWDQGRTEPSAPSLAAIQREGLIQGFIEAADKKYAEEGMVALGEWWEKAKHHRNFVGLPEFMQDQIINHVMGYLDDYVGEELLKKELPDVE